RASVPGADIIGTKAAVGKCLAASRLAGPMMVGESGGSFGSRRAVVVEVTFTCGSLMAATRAARTLSRLSPGKTRQLTVAVARCGRALLAWPASRRVATQVVR